MNPRNKKAGLPDKKRRPAFFVLETKINLQLKQFSCQRFFYLNKKGKENMRKMIPTTIVLMLLSLVGYGADWKCFGKSPTGSYHFYDTQSISRGQGTIKVRTMTILSNEDKAAYIRDFPDTKGIENIHHTFELSEINCSKNIWRLCSYAWYSFDYKFINGVDDNDSLFMEIEPDSVTFGLTAIVCKKGE
jgi:hypothetical protein